MTNTTILANTSVVLVFRDVLISGAYLPAGALATYEVRDVNDLLILAGTATVDPGDPSQWWAQIDTLPVGEYTAQLIALGTIHSRQSILVVTAPPEGATTRVRLMRSLAKRVHDGADITASTNGSTTVITSSLGFRRESGMLVGRQVVCLSATNAQNVGFITEIIESTLGTLSVSVDPPFPAAVMAGDRFFLTSERGVGWEVEDYYQAINDAILIAQPYHAVPISTTVVVPPSDSVRSLIRLNLPPKWTHFSHLEIYNEGGSRYSPGTTRSGYASSFSHDGWVRVPMSDEPGRDGERLVPHSGVIEVTGAYARMLDMGSSIRLTGYRRADELNNDYDWTTIPYEWLVYQAGANLLFSGIRTDPDRERMAAFLQRQADGSRGIIGTGILPGTRMITRQGAS